MWASGGVFSSSFGRVVNRFVADRAPSLEYFFIARRPMDPSEDDRGRNIETHQRLCEIFKPHVAGVSKMIQRDLSHWMEP